MKTHCICILIVSCAVAVTCNPTFAFLDSADLKRIYNVLRVPAKLTHKAFSLTQL